MVRNSKTFFFMTLGCPKNTVDSEVMAGKLIKKGYQPVDTLESYVDLAVLNTCGFINPSKEESIERIFDLIEYKKQGRIGKLVVTGCLSQRYHESLKNDIPELDLITGIDHIAHFEDIIESESSPQFKLPEYIYSHDTPRAVSTGRSFAYIKIADGCNHRCAFCAIPLIRGKLRSRNIDSIVAEAKILIEDGYSEIILVSQDSTSYGSDIGMKDGLAQLLESLSQIDTCVWIRPMYMFPGKVSTKLLSVINSHSNICSYFDIPLQHSSESVLRRMKRGGNGDEYLHLINKIRKEVKNAFIRTSLIVGFPGESEDDFDDLIAFVKNAKFNHLGVFTYSHEEDTGAFELEDNVPETVKQKRMKEIMEIQKEISYDINNQLIGERLNVLIEGYSEETELLLQGRHQGQAPEIDGIVYVNEGDAEVGDIKPVEIEQAMDYDILGKIIENEQGDLK